MTERERLIELILSADISLFGTDKSFAEVYADYLLANGVIIPPVKVGDTVYYIYNNTIIEYQVNTIIIYKYSQRIVVWGRSQYFEFSDFGKTVFLTREEAKKALEEMKKND